MKHIIKIRGITVKQGSRFVRIAFAGPRGPAGTGGGGGGSNIAADITFTPAGTVAATNVQAAIAEVASERVTADTSLATSITAEASSRSAADASLTTALSAEASLTVSRDASLATAISSGDTSLTAALSTAISAEASTRSVADASLTTRFSTLGYFATGTDAANLTGQIALARFPASTGLQVLRANAGNTALEFATISAGGGDMLKSDNLSGLTNLTTARSNLGLGTAAVAATGDFAPASLSSTVSTADASLTTRLGTEESTRGTADGSLTTRISTEETARASADSSLATAMAAIPTVGSDLAAIEALTGTGYAQRTADNTWVLSTPSGSGGGTKTYSVFRALDFQPPASAYATLDTRNSIACLDFDDTANESAFAVSIMPEAASLGSGLIVRIHWAATTATSGNVRWRVEFERCNTDLDTDSFDTATEATGAANGTSGIETVTAITCTTIDGITAGDLYRLRVTRVSTDTTNDTMTGDAELIAVEVRSAA